MSSCRRLLARSAKQPRKTLAHKVFSTEHRTPGFPRLCYSSLVAEPSSLPIASASAPQHIATPPPSSVTGKGPAGCYSQLISQNQLRPDPHQRETISILQNLYDQLQAYREPPVLETVTSPENGGPLHAEKGKADMLSPDFAWQREEATSGGIFGKLFGRYSKKKKVPEARYGPRSLYLYGDVGTGKTMVMDLFYHSIDIPRKRRVHFHAFMLDVHRRVHQLRVERNITHDPIPTIATELVNDAWLLCFDELQVTDITDAMILRRLLDELFKRGMVMVTTSNRPPDELYKDGIQRKSFLPTIDLLKERCVVHTLNSGIDYRKQARKKVNVFFSPLSLETQVQVDRVFKKLAKGKPVGPRTLHFLGRSLTVPAATDDLARISFKEICGQPHSAADYLEIVSHFKTLVLTDVPKMSLAQRNEARRFITLIDALYDSKTKLVMSAEGDVVELFSGEVSHVKSSGQLVDAERMLMDDLKLQPEQLTSPIFTGSEEIFAFQRAVSRLTEMQGEQWLGEEARTLLADSQ
ncbi:hypothetical protein HK104_006613 [Borealophlyctis nickersoniae]|nr:hypothetical protein HK104_006613 [Borealophlyctis nickersoniae]